MKINYIALSNEATHSPVITVVFDKGFWTPSYSELAEILYFLMKLYGKEEVNKEVVELAEAIFDGKESDFATTQGYHILESLKVRQKCFLCGGNLRIYKRWIANSNYGNYKCSKCGEVQ